MNIIKETLKQIKVLLSEEKPPVAPAEPEIPVKQVMEVTTTDGKNLSIDVMAEGGIVTMNGEPVEDGNYALLDGTTFTTENGVIKSITSATPAEVEQTAPAPTVDEEMKKQLETMQAKFAAIETAKENGSKALKAQLDKQNETIKMLFAVVEELGNNASERPIEQSKDWEKLTPLEKRRINKN
jgi:hypothetical protein